MAASREAVLDVLKGVEDPIAGSDIVASGVMRALNVDEAGSVRFVMEMFSLPRTQCSPESF